MRNAFTLLIGLLLAPLSAAEAASFYVDSATGSDVSDGGTPATAWRSLEKVNAATFHPGDRLLLKSGSAWTGLLHPQGSGSAADRIVLDRYGDGPKPAIHGGGIAGGAVLLVNQQYWSIRNLEVSNQGSPVPKKMGILIRNNSVGTLSGIEVTGCDIHDVVGELADYRDGKESGGIVFAINASNLSVPSKWDDVRIDNNVIRDVTRNGILMQSQWINKPADTNSSWRGHGAYTPSSNVRIASNRLEHIGGDGTGTFRAPKGCRFERNLFFGSGQITPDAMKILADPRVSAPGVGGMGLRSVDGYKLRAGSPALNSGVFVPENGGRDFWGNRVPDLAPPCIGAFSGAPAAPAPVTGKQKDEE
jgi:hypothetical protein